MGTNYYYHKEPACLHCGRNDEPLHIGKSSGGWAFALHVSRKETDSEWSRGLPYDFDGWLALFKIPGSVIKNEYDEIVSVEEMISIITDRKSWVAGNNDRLRHHSIDNYHCLWSGEYAEVDYDYCLGEFS